MSQSGVLSVNTTIFPTLFLTGNSGGPVGPDGGGNIDIFGNNATGINIIGTPASHLLTVLGIPSSTTQVGTVALATSVETGDLSDSTKAITPLSLSPILVTPYVVSVGGSYTTIQSAIDAAHAAGGGTIYIRPGSYTEDLTLYDKIELVGATAEVDVLNISITGVHTVPSTGTFAARNINFISATDIFNSSDTGSSSISIVECIFVVENGFTFNLPNWTGSIRVNNCNATGTNDGFLNNSAAATVFTNNSQLGAGSTQTMVANGSLRFDLTLFACPVSLSGAAPVNQLNIAFFLGPVSLAGSAFYGVAPGCDFFASLTLGGSSTGTIVGSNFSTGSSAAIIMDSSASWMVSNSTITSFNNPAIDGTGVGTLSFYNLTYTSNSSVAAGLTVINAGVTDLGSIRSNFTAHSLLLGQGSRETITDLGVATDGQIPIGSTGADPILSTLTAGTGITISNAPGSITIAAAGTTILNYTSVNSAASPYTVQTIDDYLGVDSTAASVSILLPNAPETGRVYIIKDSKGQSATNNIIVTTLGGIVTIDGSTSYVINTNYQSINLIFNGSSYEVF